MKIFISQSGEPSKTIALALKEFIADVHQHAKVWVSDRDISAGTRGEKEIEKQLEGSNFGIVCLTPSNLKAPWILFEAGALSKLPESRVCTFLYKLEHAEVEKPLGQFQGKKVDEDGTWEIIKSINDCSEDSKRDIEKLKKTFDQWYPKLKIKFEDLPPSEDQNTKKRTSDEMIPEILTVVRELQNRSQTDIRQFPPQSPFFHPGNMVDTSRLGELNYAQLNEIMSQLNQISPSGSSAHLPTEGCVSEPILPLDLQSDIVVNPHDVGESD